MRFVQKNWQIIALILTATFLRFYKLSEWFFFNIDEERLNFIIRRIIVFKRPVLTGWEIPGGILVPPVNYYFGALVMVISGNNLIGQAVTASLFGVFGVFLIFFVGEKIFKSRTVAFYACLIYSFSYLVNIYNRLSINLLFGPVLSLLTYWSLFKVIVQKQKKWLFVLSVIFIFATQEGSMISLIFLTLISLAIFKVKLKTKDYLLPLLIFFLSFIPLLIFDFRHNFYISRKFLGFFGSIKINQSQFKFPGEYFNFTFRTFSRFLWPTGPNDLNLQILPCKNYLTIINSQTPAFFSVIGFLIISFFVCKSFSKKALFGQKIITLHLLIILFGMFVYSLVNPGYLYEWFFIVFTPALGFIVAYLLVGLRNYKLGRILSFILLIGFILYNLKTLLTATAAIGYQDKISAIKYSLGLIAEKNFSLEVIGNNCNGFGYRYLFSHFGKEPVASYTDHLYAGWLYPKETEKKSDYKLVLVPLTDLDTLDSKNKYQDYKDKSINNKRFGNLEVLLIKENEILR